MIISTDYLKSFVGLPDVNNLFSLIETIGHELCHAYQHSIADLFKKDPKYFKIINDGYREIALSFKKRALPQEEVIYMCGALKEIYGGFFSNTINNIIKNNNLLEAICYGSYLELEYEKQARKVGYNFCYSILMNVLQNEEISEINGNDIAHYLAHTSFDMQEKINSGGTFAYNKFNQLISKLNLTEILEYETKIDNLLKKSDNIPKESVETLTRHSKIICEIYRRFIETLSSEELFECFDIAIAQKHVFLQTIIKNKIFDLYNTEQIPQELINKYTTKYINFIENEANPKDLYNYYNDITAYIGTFANTDEKLSLIKNISSNDTISSGQKYLFFKQLFLSIIKYNNFEFIKNFIEVCKNQLCTQKNVINSKENNSTTPLVTLLYTLRQALDSDLEDRRELLTDEEYQQLFNYFTSIQNQIDEIIKNSNDTTTKKSSPTKRKK